MVSIYQFGRSEGFQLYHKARDRYEGAVTTRECTHNLERYLTDNWDNR